MEREKGTARALASNNKKAVFGERIKKITSCFKLKINQTIFCRGSFGKKTFVTDKNNYFVRGSIFKSVVMEISFSMNCAQAGFRCCCCSSCG